MQRGFHDPLRALLTPIAVVLLLLASPAQANFDQELERLDEALRTNPNKVLQNAVDACIKRRSFAIRQFNAGENERAARSLRSCFRLLKLPETAPEPEIRPPTQQELAARATRELEEALALTPDLDNGRRLYRECAACHEPEGWCLRNGSVPQIAGQHRSVVVKQLADIRAGNRDALLMVPYASVERIGSAQGVADVAAYIDTLEMSVATGKGPGKDLELGERLYRENCQECHGATGEGDAAEYVPRIQAQHYNYLVRQFEWIRDGKRRNSNPEMVEQIGNLKEQETSAVLDYVSRLEPPEVLRAPPGWKNPDFVE